jgi:hypothetical protein
MVRQGDGETRWWCDKVIVRQCGGVKCKMVTHCDHGNMVRQCNDETVSGCDVTQCNVKMQDDETV